LKSTLWWYIIIFWIIECDENWRIYISVVKIWHLITECLKYKEDAKKHNISSNIDAVLGPNTEYINNMINFFKKNWPAQLNLDENGIATHLHTVKLKRCIILKYICILLKCMYNLKKKTVTNGFFSRCNLRSIEKKHMDNTLGCIKSVECI